MKHVLKSGMTIGKLTLIREVPSEKGRGPEWLCRCSCGNTEEKTRMYLVNPKLQHRCRSCFIESMRKPA